MGFGAVPAQGLIGVPDDVPGRDILVPFFYVSMPGFGNDNTIITITEVKGTTTDITYIVYNRNGDEMCDVTLSLNGNGVLTIDALTIINSWVEPVDKPLLEFDADGDGVNDHWVGYIFFDTTSSATNNLISHVYQVDLSAGRAASYNPPRLEHPSTVADPRQVYPAGTDFFAGNETYSANALWIGKNLLAGEGVPVSHATLFGLKFRYFIMNKNSTNLFIIWVDSAHTGIPVPGTVIGSILNEDGVALSHPITIDYGLNIFDVGNSFLPVSWLQEYPVAGWVDIMTSGLSGNGSDADRSWVGYSWQRNSGENPKGKPIKKGGWDVIQPADRETDDVP